MRYDCDARFGHGKNDCLIVSHTNASVFCQDRNVLARRFELACTNDLLAVEKNLAMGKWTIRPSIEMKFRARGTTSHTTYLASTTLSVFAIVENFDPRPGSNLGHWGADRSLHGLLTF